MVSWRPSRWATSASITSGTWSISRPCPGASVWMAGVASRTRARLARYWCRSPSGGRITTVEPCITWSPVSSSSCSSTSQHRWFEAWPGVCSARSVRSPVRRGCPDKGRVQPSPARSSGSKSSAGPKPTTRAPGGRGQRGRARRVVDVRVGDEDGADRAQRGGGRHDGGGVRGIGRAGVDDDRLGAAHEVGVRPRSGHEARIGGGQPQDAGAHLVHRPGAGAGPMPKSGTAGITTGRSVVRPTGAVRARCRGLPRWPAWRPRARPR